MNQNHINHLAALCFNDVMHPHDGSLDGIAQKERGVKAAIEWMINNFRPPRADGVFDRTDLDTVRVYGLSISQIYQLKVFYEKNTGKPADELTIL